jgi:hypothetical protein
LDERGGSDGKWDESVLHAQIEAEITIVGAASIKNQHGRAGIMRSLPPLLDLGAKSETENGLFQKTTGRLSMI